MLRVVDVAEPAPPRRDQVLVRVVASSVNGTDLGIRSEGAPAVFGRVHGPGFDLAGEVLACGPQVAAFDVGDRIAALLPHSGGGQAERVVVRQHRAARLPGGIDPTTAAAVPLAGLTALQGLYGRAGLRGRRPGARVLVHGASGGIGAFAVQLARLAGAQVTGTASPGKQAFVREMGAHEVLGHDEALASGRYDVVLDTPGRLEPADVRPVLADDGVVVTTRVASRTALRAVAAGALRRSGPRSLFVATAARPADLAHLLALVASGDLRVPVDRVVPLPDVVEAHRHAESPDVRGKVVVRVS